jgi:hypothetical protein
MSMQTVWILFYLNKYMAEYGVFASEQDALDFASQSRNPEYYTPVELPIQPAGITYDTMIKVNPPQAGMR